MGCVQDTAINPYNFLRWHAVADTTFPFAVPLPYCQAAGLACAVYLDPTLDEGYPTLPVVAGDKLRFYINSEDGLVFDGGLAGVALGLAQNGKLVTPSAGQLYGLDDDANPGAAFVYGVLEIDCQPEGTYWPVLYAVGTGRVLYLANPVQVVNWTAWRLLTSWVRFRHPFKLYGVDYGGLPGLYQEFRLGLVMEKSKFPTDETNYTDRNNYTRTTRLGITKVSEVNSDFWDQDTYQAAALMFTHKDVFINGTSVKIQGALDADFTDGTIWTVAKGKVLDRNFSRTVLSC